MSSDHTPYTITAEITTAGPDTPAVDQPLERAASGNGASTSGSSAANDVLEKLASLHVARRAGRDRRREESRAAADPRESVTQFLQGFSSRQRRVEAALQSMLLQQQGAIQPQAAAAAVTAQPAGPLDGSEAPLAVSTATPEQVQSSLELLSSEVLSLEQCAAAASYYLPLYDQKQCAAAVAALRSGIEGARSVLAPRRRFAFGSKKVSKVRGEEVSAAAQAAGPAAPAPATAVASAAAPGGAAAPSAPAPSAAEPAAASTDATSISASAAAAAAAAAAVAPDADADADAPASLVVSEQDCALVARGRGLMGLTDAEVVLRVEEVEEGGGVGQAGPSGATSGAPGGPGTATGGDFVLLGLTRCRVVLLGRLRALRLAGLRGCTVVAGPVTGAVFADDVRGCSLALASYQVRVHRTHATDLFLRVRSKPIIEHSTGVRVAPWAARVAREPQLEALMQAHKLGEAGDAGSWQQVDDFGWIKAVQSPNWCVMPEDARPAEPTPVPEGVWERRAAASGETVAQATEEVDEI